MKNSILLILSASFFMLRAEEDDIYRIIKNGNTYDLEKVLYENPQSIRQRDAQGKTPLHCAAETGNLDVVYMLLEKNANVNALDKIGRTPLHYAVVANSTEAGYIIIALQDARADINAKDNDGNTPMHLASQLGSTVPILYLTKSKANVDDRNHLGQRPASVVGTKSPLGKFLSQFSRERGSNTSPANSPRQGPIWQPIAQEEKTEPPARKFWQLRPRNRIV